MFWSVFTGMEKLRASFWVSVFSNAIIYVLNYTPSSLPPHGFVSFPSKHHQIIYNHFLLVEFVYLVS